MKQYGLERHENRTVADIKQLAWALLLVAPFLAIAAYGASRMLGTRTAFLLGIGLGAYVVVVFAFIVALCVSGSYAYALIVRLKQRLDRSHTS